jgi:hypothetical protein
MRLLTPRSLYFNNANKPDPVAPGAIFSLQKLFLFGSKEGQECLLRRTAPARYRHIDSWPNLLDDEQTQAAPALNLRRKRFRRPTQRISTAGGTFCRLRVSARKIVHEVEKSTGEGFERTGFAAL